MSKTRPIRSSHSNDKRRRSTDKAEPSSSHPRSRRKTDHKPDRKSAHKAGNTSRKASSDTTAHTEVRRGTEDIERERIDVHATLSFVLGLLSLGLSLIPISAISGLMSSITLLKWSVILLVLTIPPAFIFGITAKKIVKNSKYIIGGNKRANIGLISAGMATLYLLLVLAAIPSHSQIYYLMQTDKCEQDLSVIAEGVESYISYTRSLPKNLQAVVTKGHISQLPQCMSQDYLYTVVKDPKTSKEHYTIACPEPEKLIKGSGFSRPQQVVELKYVQHKGIISETKPLPKKTLVPQQPTFQ